MVHNGRAPLFSQNTQSVLIMLALSFLADQPINTFYPGDITRTTLLAFRHAKKRLEKPGEVHEIVFSIYDFPKVHSAAMFGQDDCRSILYVMHVFILMC